MRYFQKEGLLKGDVLDFGSGKDVHPYTRFDPYYDPDPKVLTYQYDVVTCNYVLNVIEEEKDRAEVIRTIKSLLSGRGYALISVYQGYEKDTRTTKGFQSGWGEDEWNSFLNAHFRIARRLDSKSFMSWMCVK